MPAVSRRERWLVGVAVLVAAILGGYIYVVEPLRAREQELSQLAPARENVLQGRRELVGRRAALTAELAEATERLEAQSGRLLQGPTPPLAASELQRIVKDVASSAGVEMRSERILTPVERDGLQQVPLEITVAGSIRESVTLLQQLEQTEKLLAIQDVKMRVVSVGQPRELLTTLTVAGYLLLGSPSAKPGEPVAGTERPARPNGPRE
ncbi:MAG: type II secretion system protein GspM [Candidatus Rokubacteria bacterium]|nr:type II secretion system protein GspM [Candidatus Rokubacteria bacterium]